MDYQKLASDLEALRDNLNLDSLTDAELNTIYHATRITPVNAARILFPAKPAGYVTAAKLLGRYAVNLIVAREQRRLGFIETARKYETILDSNIYPRLPEFAKW